MKTIKTTEKNQLNEKLLNAWLRISTSVNNDRVVTELSYNESLICNVLYQNQQKEEPAQLTATDICHATNMLKSQANRTLNQLEEKGIITRLRSSDDKRQVYIALSQEKDGAYERQHAKILDIVDHIIEKLGIERAQEATALLNDISDIADRLFSGKGEQKYD